MDMRYFLLALLSSACSAPTPVAGVTLRLDSPVAQERVVGVSVEETDVQTNVLVDDVDIRVAVVVSKSSEIDNAVGFWQDGGDFLVCKADLSRDGRWLAFESACASGRVLLPE
jgi:hypothetical protein